MTSCLSPCSALSLVRQRIHALRQSMELLMKLISLGDDFMIVSVFSAELGSLYALRLSTLDLDFTAFLREGGLGPLRSTSVAQLRRRLGQLIVLVVG